MTPPETIDSGDALYVEAQIDSGGYSTILAFEANGDGTNELFQLVGGTATLGNSAQTFIAPISGTGSTLDLRLVVSLDSGDEDFAVDNFVIGDSNSIPEPGAALLGSFGLLGLLRRRR